MGNTFTYPPGPQLDKEIAHVKHGSITPSISRPTIRIFAGDCKRTRPRLKRGNGASRRSSSAATTPAAGHYSRSRKSRRHRRAVDQLLSIVKASNPTGSASTGTPETSAAPIRMPISRSPRPTRWWCRSRARSLRGRERRPTSAASSAPEDSGLSGFVALEYEAKEDPFVAVPRHLKELRRLLAAG